MKYFFPDAQDLVDPSFDFRTEDRSASRLRQRDDLYAHEVFSTRAFDGLLVSKGIVDGFSDTSSRYSLSQRHRLLRVGAPEFFRIADAKFKPLPIMGDCGAFTYVKEDMPPYSVDEVLSFYTECQFNLGISIDHVILDFKPEWDAPGAKVTVPAALVHRRELTIELAAEFFKKHRSGKLGFEPMGVAQGWSPKSYAASVKELQAIGYDYIAMGGMVPLKTPEILASLAGVSAVRKPKTRLHLLGVTRTEQVQSFSDYGVYSFDSTSPLRQAFKDDKNNYYTMEGAYTAIRIPQVDGNASLGKLILSGQVKQEAARRLEKACLSTMEEFDAGKASVTQTVKVLREYEHLYDPKKDHTEAYEQTLADSPWRHCRCDICRKLGHHVILFRGAERNRRRGLHNVWMFYRRLQQRLGTPTTLRKLPGERPSGRVSLVASKAAAKHAEEP
jgi:hypothetical protein